MKIRMDRSPHPCCVSRLWYCDVTQTPIVTSFWPIIIRKFLTGSLASSRRRQVVYNSLIIESGPCRFRWLACKKFSIHIGLSIYSLSYPVCFFISCVCIKIFLQRYDIAYCGDMQHNIMHPCTTCFSTWCRPRSNIKSYIWIFQPI